MPIREKKICARGKDHYDTHPDPREQPPQHVLVAWVRAACEEHGRLAPPAAIDVIKETNYVVIGSCRQNGDERISQCARDPPLEVPAASTRALTECSKDRLDVAERPPENQDPQINNYNRARGRRRRRCDDPAADGARERGKQQYRRHRLRERDRPGPLP